MKKKHNIFRGEDLSDYKKFLNIRKKCVVCGSAEFETWANFGSYRAVKCKRCGLKWMYPHLSVKGLEIYYKNYLGRRRLSNGLKMKQRSLQYQDDRRFVETFVPHGRVLDVGCSGGFFLAALDRKFKKYGIEIDPLAVKYAQKNFDFGKHIRLASLEEAPFKSEYFDLIIMRGTIEHLPEPIVGIKRVSSLLKKGGYFYISATPNGACFSASLYRENWNLFHPVQHIWYFSPQNLETICERFGLKLVASEFPYLGTPYEDVENDILSVAEAIKLRRKHKKNKNVSHAFWGNMMSLVFQKK